MKAALLPESRRAESAENRRPPRERTPQFEQHLTDEQLYQRARFEVTYRANQLRRLPTVFGDLT